MQQDIPPYRLHRSIGYWLSLAARLQERRLDDKLRDLGLTRITWCILLGVANEGITQPSDLAEFVGIDRTAASRALRQMESAGLIERLAGTGDRRTRQISLTAAGQEAVHAGTPFARENAAILSDRLAPGETAELLRLLKALTEGEESGLSTL